MSKGGQQTTEVTNALDPATQAFIDQFRQQAGGTLGTGALGQGLEAFNALPGQNAGLASAFGAGQGLLDFLPQAGAGLDISEFFDPFQADVISGVQSDFDRQRGLADVQARGAATAAGAFGGSREAILRSEAARNIGDRESQVLANVRSQGFRDATGSAFRNRGFGANLGLQGLSQVFQSGQLGKILEQARAAGITNIPGLLAGLFQTGFTPGSTTATQTVDMPSNTLGNILGAGATIGGLLFPPAGAAAAATQFALPGLTGGPSGGLSPNFGFGG